MTLRWWPGIVVLGLVSCSRPPAPSDAPSPRAPARASATSLDDLVRRDLTEHGALPWSAERRVRWRDFRAAPRRSGREAAHISYGIYYAWSCRGRAFAFRVVAAMHPDESWVKPEIVRDSAESRRALGHEQTHFHITEVYARRMRRHFAALSDPCARDDAALEREAERFVEDQRAAQRRYDAETEHGLRPREQAAWDAQIRRELGIAREDGD